MNVAFRVDASQAMGTGHVARCAALADTLRSRGADVAFISRELPGHYCGWLEEHGFTVHRLPAPAAGESVDDKLPHAEWLGVTQRRDVEDTNIRLGDRRWDWIIVDHYGLDAEWETALRKNARRILVIDDLADREHDADILVDPNLQSASDRYEKLVSDRARQFLGPAYAPLRAEFSTARKRLRNRNGELDRIFVFMGGSDPLNLTEMVLAGVEQSKLDVSVDVAMGASAPHLRAVARACALRQNCTLHVQTNRMAELIVAADLAIGAPGSATWERCVLGLPSLLVIFADNQKEVAAAIARRRAGLVLGKAEEITASTIAGVLRRIRGHPGLLRGMSRRAKGITSGVGAMLIADQLFN